MEIRIILDDRIVNGARRVFSRSGLAALTAVALLAGGAALVAQEANDASNVFSPGEVISSAAVNQNFQELHDLAQAQDEEIAEKVSGIDLVTKTLTFTGNANGYTTTTATADFCYITENTAIGNGSAQASSGKKIGCKTHKAGQSGNLWYMDAFKADVGGTQYCEWRCVTFN
jgi:hypothetical protein